MFCRRCGARIPEGLGMCPACGLETNAPWQPAPSQPAAAAPAASAPPPPSADAVPTPVGVGGWLLFFCICLTILWPLWMTSQYVLFHFAFRGLGWLGPLRLVLGIGVGIMLWTKNPGAMGLLRVYFGLSVLLTLWASLNWMRVVLSMHAGPSTMAPFIRGFAVPLVFLVAAIVYFAQSERVRATYGSKLF